jgi:DNA-binding HxlR family transcriptional regulator
MVWMAADLLGDRWSLLILRNMMLREVHSFKELLESGEGIATNILSSRLKKLLAHKIVEVRREPSDRRRRNYRLTSKGKALAPVLAEMVLWTARYSTAADRNRRR